MTYCIGIDVGGTNVDAVLLDSHNRIVAKTKQITTSQVMQGINKALEVLLADKSINRALIHRAMLGTTHCTNAIVERKGLSPIAHFRLTSPAALSIAPLTDMPLEFKNSLSVHLFSVKGGYHYDGTLFSALDEETLRKQLYSIKDVIKSVSVCGLFSSITDEQERRAEVLIKEILGDSVAISLSSQVGTIGLLERENATILNAALCQVAKGITEGFQQTLKRHDISAELYFGQNDGTLMSLSQARKFPVLTIASGPTNSIFGAAKLAGLDEAIVVDVGGTTTDVGIVKNGYPRQSYLSAEIGGVRTNFRMPDVTSIGLGGGSVVKVSEDNTVTIGPESVGYQLPQKSLVFGGDVLTVTDIAVAMGWANIGDGNKIAYLSSKLVEKAARCYVSMIESVLEKMNNSANDLPVILVGGGAELLPIKLKGASKVIRLLHSGVANAIGVAMAQVSGSVDMIISTKRKTLETYLEQAENMAIKAAVEAGAVPESITLIELESLPLGYMSENTIRIKAKAAGSLRR
ncbi:hydantoinase/oxoprolinase family protein [Arsenophonus nasoniae]|uniref:hydantoinase/oxoprolinase family protein n=1 Tax=Arsenophonus nasoniae TaxID=638 RepID=UPI0038793F8C